MTSKIIKLILLSIPFFYSCNSYLDKEPDDMQTLEGVFEKRASTEQYLANVLSFLPNQWDNLGLRTYNSYSWPFTPASDEGEWGAVRVYAQMQNGTHSAASPAENFWTPLYRGIRESNVFMQNVDKCTELTDEERGLWKAEARYVNIMCHYWLAMLYGPIVLVKDELIDPNTTEYRARNTWEECVTWITENLKDVADDLPLQQEEIYLSKPTKMAALAYRSRLLLYSASDLMNGNSYFASVKNQDGTALFPAQKDMSKWRVAAEAAKEIIDFCESDGTYGLLEGTEDECLKGIAYKRVFTENWNKELLDAKDLGNDVYVLDLTPAPLGERFHGHATACVTQQQVDAYAMSNGIYPITGYQRNGSPIIDETSGYSEEGFSTFSVPTFDSNNGGYTGEAYNMYKDREPRFYASVAYNEGVWPNTVVKTPIFLNKYGTEGASNSDYNRTGYLVTKFTHPSSSVYNPYSLVWRRCWPNFRYAEILLNYVEAKIELEEVDNFVLECWNSVRKRAGVPDIESIYPTVASDKALATFLIRRERQVEFAFENIRWFDCNRWKISTETNDGPAYGMNVNVTSAATMRQEYYKRTPFETRVFKENQYLQPIPQSSLVKNLLLVQNPGW